MIKIAKQPVSTVEKKLLLPQLVEARIQRGDPNVRLEIVFDPTLTQFQKKRALEELENIFSGPLEMHDRPILKASQATIHKNFCANKEKYARLGVRLVLMGEYGLDEIKVKNRPESNKIYSKDGLETAEGFIPIRYFEIKRGSEPYFAPIGWRRVAVDTGLLEEQFWDMYIKVLLIIKVEYVYYELLVIIYNHSSHVVFWEMTNFSMILSDVQFYFSRIEIIWYTLSKYFGIGLPMLSVLKNKGE